MRIHKLLVSFIVVTAALVGGSLLSLLSPAGLSEAADLPGTPVGDFSNLKPSDIKAAWVDKATINVTFGGKTYQFFDDNVGDTNNNFKIVNSSCDGKLDMPDGQVGSIGSTGTLDIDFRLPNGGTGSENNGCAKTNPNKLTIAVTDNKLSGVGANVPSSTKTLVYKYGADENTIIRSDNNGDWVFTRDGDIYKRNKESGDKCQDFIIVTKNLSTHQDTMVMYEIGENGSQSLPKDIEQKYAQGCKYAKDQKSGVSSGVTLPLGGVNTGTPPNASTSSGQTSSNGGASATGSTPIDEYKCDLNHDGVVSPEEARTKDCSTECNDAEESNNLGLKEGSGGCIYKYINIFLNVLTAGVGIVILIMVIIGGYGYLTSSGDPSKTAAARGRIMNAIIALVAFILMYVVLQWLIPGGAF